MVRQKTAPRRCSRYRHPRIDVVQKEPIAGPSNGTNEKKSENPCELCKISAKGYTRCPVVCGSCSQGYHRFDAMTEVILQQWRCIYRIICSKCRPFYLDCCLFLFYVNNAIYYIYCADIFSREHYSDKCMCKRCPINLNETKVLLLVCPNCKEPSASTNDAYRLQCKKCKIWLAGFCGTAAIRNSFSEKVYEQIVPNCMICHSRDQPRPLPRPPPPRTPSPPPPPPPPPPSPSPPPDPQEILLKYNC